MRVWLSSGAVRNDPLRCASGESVELVRGNHNFPGNLVPEDLCL